MFLDEYLSSSPKFQKIAIPLFVIMLLHTLVVNGHAESNNNQIKAYRTYESIEIDGDLTEADWQHAQPMDRFVQVGATCRRKHV